MITVWKDKKKKLPDINQFWDTKKIDQGSSLCKIIETYIWLNKKTQEHQECLIGRINILRNFRQ